MRVANAAAEGYWPESLLTPPDSGAISRDLEMVKAQIHSGMRQKNYIPNGPFDLEAAGFNTVRVHAVVMGEAFYDECDKLGLLVWQVPSAHSIRACMRSAHRSSLPRTCQPVTCVRCQRGQKDVRSPRKRHLAAEFC